MPWYRLPSGLPWWGHHAPTSGVPIDHPGNVPVNHSDDTPPVGSDVEVETVSQVDKPEEIVPRVPGVGGEPELDGTETAPVPVEDLMSFTVTVLRERADKLGIHVPGHARKADIVALIHAAEDTSG